MISIVTWRWGDWSADVVNIARAMVARHYPHPHRFLCVSNDGAGLDSGIEVIPDRQDYADVLSPHGRGCPSCYRRLRAFAPGIGKIFGERFVLLDLDFVAVADLTPVWNRTEDFVAWRDPIYPKQYNGSMVLMNAGARQGVWSRFDPTHSPQQARAAGFAGSDQAWISYCLRGESTWNAEDGVYSYRVHKLHALPANARIVVFHGNPKPWAANVAPWVREHWQQ